MISKWCSWRHRSPFRVDAKSSKTNIEKIKDQRFWKWPDRDAKIKEILSMDDFWETTTEWIDTRWRKTVFEYARNLFDAEWRDIVRKWWQKIRITNTWIKKSIYEAFKKKNPEKKEKFAAFKLLPKVLKEWKLINIEYDRKWYWADTYMYAAPIVIDWKRYICTVSINKNWLWDNFTYYLHEVGKDIDWQ